MFKVKAKISTAYETKEVCIQKQYEMFVLFQTL